MSTPNLPTIITRASSRLMAARDSAEVLEAKHIAEAALHYAKVTKAANETHADCLRIITRAEMRMANELDKKPSAQGRRTDIPRVAGEVTYKELGVDDRRVSEWRAVRDAGEEEVERVIRRAVDEGRAPTKREILRTVRGQVEPDTDDEWEPDDETKVAHFRIRVDQSIRGAHFEGPVTPEIVDWALEAAAAWAKLADQLQS